MAKAPAKTLPKPKQTEAKPVGRPSQDQITTPPIGREPSQEPLPDVEPDDEAVELAKVLCAAHGDNPSNFRMGKPRWEGHLFAARQQIAAFDFLMAARGITEQEDGE